MCDDRSRKRFLRVGPTCIRTTMAQRYVNQAVTYGVERQKVHPGSVTFIQRARRSLNLNVHYHLLFLEDLCLDRSDQGLKPRFMQGEPSTDTDITAVIQKSCQRSKGAVQKMPFEIPMRGGIQ